MVVLTYWARSLGAALVLNLLTLALVNVNLSTLRPYSRGITTRRRDYRSRPLLAYMAVHPRAFVHVVCATINGCPLESPRSFLKAVWSTQRLHIPRTLVRPAACLLLRNIILRGSLLWKSVGLPTLPYILLILTLIRNPRRPFY